MYLKHWMIKGYFYTKKRLTDACKACGLKVILLFISDLQS